MKTIILKCFWKKKYFIEDIEIFCSISDEEYYNMYKFIFKNSYKIRKI